MLDAISKESQRSIEAHLTDFESKLRAANRTDKHITSTTQFIRWIADHAGFRTASDISADGVNRYAGKLRNEGRAARTIQAHLNAIKGFTKWLAEHHKLPRDPLASVKLPNPKADRRRERRMLLPEEWRLLETAIEAGPERYGMTGSERLLLYRTAIQTGLRSNELRSLTRGQLYFDSDPPYITCKAGSTKNRKDARQYIQPELAAGLKAHIATKAPKASVFNLPHETNLARMLRDDLAEARKQWLSKAKGVPQEYSQRQQSDFLTDTNHEGELIDASLWYANLTDANLTDAFLEGADLSSADLSGSDLSSVANYTGSTWTDAFYYTDNDPTWGSGMDQAWRDSVGILAVSAVPEPAAILLALLGLALLPRRRRR